MKRLVDIGASLSATPFSGVPARSCCALLTVVSFVLAGLLLADTGVFAQTPIPPNIDVTNRQGKEKPKLNRDSRELADEYAELLLNLDEITANYNQYLEDYNDDVVKQYRPALDQLRRQLDSLRFAGDEQLLAEQLRKHAEQLHKAEIHIRDSKTIYPMRLYRLVQALRRELVSLDDLMQDDILPRLSENESFRSAIAAYVTAVLRENRRAAVGRDELREATLKDSILAAIDMSKIKSEAKRMLPFQPGQLVVQLIGVRRLIHILKGRGSEGRACDVYEW